MLPQFSVSCFFIFLEIHEAEVLRLTNKKDPLLFEGTGEKVVTFQTAGLSIRGNYYYAELEDVPVTKSAVNNKAAISCASNVVGLLLWKGCQPCHILRCMVFI